MSQSTLRSLQSSSQSCSSSSTFSTLIQEIETSMLKEKYEAQPPTDDLVRYHKKWSAEERRILSVLVQEYGSDFAYFKRFLPFKTRKQIQRGYEMHANRQMRLHKLMQKRERKDRFDAELLSDDMVVC